MIQLKHAYQFIAGTDPAESLVLLHGSGGDERDLVALAEELAPGSSVLGRGTIAIDGRSGFFHRLPDRSIDEADISERTPLLAEFIEDATASHRLIMAPIAIGFPSRRLPCCRPVPGCSRVRSYSGLSHRSGMIRTLVWMGCRC
jgi:predicted esterase